MKISLKKVSICLSALLFSAGAVPAQTDAQADSVVEFKPSGKLWGYAFGDFAFKGSADTINGGGRGGSNQYTKVPANANMFQFRRVYLGYNYDISKKFSAEFLIAAEDDWGGGIVPGTGDVLANNKFAPYVKLANLRWKNIWNGTDLIIGQSATPTFAKNGSGMASEEVWGYRSIERTITHIRLTGSFDFGATLQGHFDHDANFGYTVMVANGNGAKAEADNYKWFYGDVWGKFFDKHLIVDIYQDYEKIDWGVFVKGYNGPRYHDRNMTKLFAAWNTPFITIGFEGFMNTILGDVNVTGKDNNTYYRTTRAMGTSLFVRGRIIGDKLGYFARFDNYDPTGNLSNIAGEANTAKYTAGTSQYEPTTKEMFSTFGFDFTPIKNVHIMPNVWLNTYESGLAADGKNSAGASYASMNPNVNGSKGTDAVYRLTFYYIYGK